MLKKLRLRFVAAIMVVVTVILAAAFAAICIVSYGQASAQVYAELEAALTHDRTPPEIMRFEEPEGLEKVPFELGATEQHKPFIPVAVYEVSPAGSLEAVSNVGNAAISDELLQDVAEAIADASDGTGEIEQAGLVYAKRDVMGRTMVAFADSSSVSSWQGLAAVLAVVGAIVLAIFLAASILFSKWALKPVRQAWERQQRFVSDASHELKTPLAVMAANNAILQRNAQNTVASQSRWIESSETEIATMRELVDDMLYMSSADEGALQEGARESMDLSRLVEAQLLQFESLAFEKAVCISASIAEGISVVGVRAQLDRLVRTLLDNAFKYVPEGGEVDVRLACDAAGKPAFSVRNSGTPIPPEELPHVFDRFYRADKARTRKEGGYGLGLSIAHDIAEANDAELSVRSDAETGTTFTVAFR